MKDKHKETVGQLLSSLYEDLSCPYFLERYSYKYIDLIFYPKPWFEILKEEK